MIIVLYLAILSVDKLVKNFLVLITGCRVSLRVIKSLM